MAENEANTTTERRACTNNGCGKVYVDAENNETACEYHAQGPIFHEGLKGWACCKKRVVSFDDFLAIPGCTVGRHRHEPGVPKPTAGSMGVDKGPAKETPKVVSETDGGAVYTLSEALSGLDPGSGTGTTASPPELPPPTQTETGPKEEELNDPADATIPVGTKCRRRGCGCEYAGPESREDECTFHPGVAIFHEGSKGYSCCSRKVLEFDQFLKLPGCKKGKHRFLEVAGVDGVQQAKQETQVRHDFYQTQTTVIITFYAKNADKEKSKVEFEQQRLKVSLVFKDGKEFTYDTPLVQPIRPEESKSTIYGTKVEVVLRKANGISWPTIEPTDKPITSWTTFGVQGRFGSIGAQEMILGQDAPIPVARRS